MSEMVSVTASSGDVPTAFTCAKYLVPRLRERASKRPRGLSPVISCDRLSAVALTSQGRITLTLFDDRYTRYLSILAPVVGGSHETSNSAFDVETMRTLVTAFGRFLT